MCSSEKVFTFFEEHIWEIASGVSLGSAFGKMVKWQKINGEHFPIFQKQSPSAVLLKRCLSFLKNTSGGMLLEFLKKRYIVRRRTLFLLSGQKDSLLFYKNLE